MPDDQTSGQAPVPQGPRGIAFDRPTLIPAAAATRFLWGDRDAGYVSDWIYGSSPRIHMMSFEMPMGTRFGNSPDFKTFYNCAETYHCLKGEFTFHCPETGEVHVMRTGDTLYFPPDTWHWGYNFGAETCRILESLTPRTEDAVETYAKARPWLETIASSTLPGLGEYLPGGSRGPQRARLARAGDVLHEIVGDRRPTRVAIVVSTDMLTTGFIELYPGQEGEPMRHVGDKVVYALAGISNVHVPVATPNWWELRPGDAAFIPAGCDHAFFNTSDASARVLFSTAPGYR